ncbi:unnamed protein product [Acanthosepion pharaonis]|uniref:Uncharacterized protein n=1 Tax=Acanthosepion pharaonis TaxID=158019 RepID=A0A812BZZ7_ACAPH|nr:unnamed protein product [Sepia pharaonis]
MSQLYSFKAEDPFFQRQPNLILQGCRDSFHSKPRDELCPSLFLLQGCRRFLQQPNNNASETTSCPSFILQAFIFLCRRSFQQPNGNAQETTYVLALFLLLAVEDSFQQPNGNASETTFMSQLFLFKAVEDSFQQPNGNASETTCCPSFIPSRL